MRLSNSPSEALDKVRGSGQGHAAGKLSRTRAGVCEKVDEGCLLRCGELRLWTGPLEFLFTPREGKLTHVVTIHAELFALAHEDERLATILRQTANTIDGRMVQGVCKLFYPRHKVVRHSGSNFIFDLTEYCLKHSQRLFLLGASETSNALAVERLRKEFPGLQVYGFSPPVQRYPFDPAWNNEILKRIEEFRSHHLVVCLGPKKQEYWIHENASDLTELGVRCAYGLGGTIDFLAGVKPRAPKWIQFIGAEWLFRLVREPGRFGRTLIMFKMPLYAAKTVREISPLT